MSELPDDGTVMRLLRDPQTRNTGLALLITRMRDPIRKHIQKNWSKEVQAREGVSEIEQLVWMVFNQRLDQGVLPAEDWDLLRAWLLEAARLKTLERVKHHRRAKRTINRETIPASEDSAEEPVGVRPSHVLRHSHRPPPAKPTAASAFESADSFERDLWDEATVNALTTTWGVAALEFQTLLEESLELFTPKEREYLVLRLKGNTREEIARRLDCAEKTVTRLGARVHEKLRTSTVVIVITPSGAPRCVRVHRFTTAADILAKFPNALALRNQATGEVTSGDMIPIPTDPSADDLEFTLVMQQS